MGLRRSAIVAVFVLAGVGATAATAGLPIPLSPANGASVTVIPPKGFANGSVPFRWSITYPDCPGPANIHSSYVHFREAGSGEFRATSGGGPFLGDGTFRKQRTRCLALKRRPAELKRCAKLKPARRAACVRAAQAAFRRATG